MFGFVIPYAKALSEQEQKRYQAFYCGLCDALKCRYGAACRLTLNFDLTFLVLLLSSLREEDEESHSVSCPRHLMGKHRCVTGELADYAADMTILLTYYHWLDDLEDDRSKPALLGLRLLQGKVPAIEQAYPAQAKALRDNLQALSDLEKQGETNPDLPAACFGRIVGEIFATGGIAEDGLRAFGEALGRLIYLMDAACDLKKDLKKERYNPLVALPVEEHEAMLRLMSAACARLFEKLPVRRDKRLMENILYSGIWTKYRATRPKGEKQP